MSCEGQSNGKSMEKGMVKIKAKGTAVNKTDEYPVLTILI